MGIFHGDNTGLFYAKMLMAKLYRALGDESSAARHEDEAAALKERIMKHLWNGRFFRHFLPLTDVDYGVDETWQMSLSNAYALNRGILSMDERLSVIASYRAMRDKYKGEMDDFRNLEPPYPVFKGMKAGQYVNGAVAPFVAGQLATAAFDVGEETYGVDILKRIGRKVSHDGKFSFLWNWEGNDIGGGPRCWCAAEIMNAETTGLAGVVDNGKLFEDVTLSPRFAAAKEKRAYVKLVYLASKAAVEYEFNADYNAKQLDFQLVSNHRSANLHMYVPNGAKPISTSVNGQAVDFQDETIGKSHYAVLNDLPKQAHVTIQY